MAGRFGKETLSLSHDESHCIPSEKVGNSWAVETKNIKTDL